MVLLQENPLKCRVYFYTLPHGHQAQRHDISMAFCTRVSWRSAINLFMTARRPFEDDFFRKYSPVLHTEHTAFSESNEKIGRALDTPGALSQSTDKSRREQSEYSSKIVESFLYVWRSWREFRNR